MVGRGTTLASEAVAMDNQARARYHVVSSVTNITSRNAMDAMRREKATYARPSLQRLGAVRTLTAGGSIFLAETAANPSNQGRQKT